MKKIVSIIVMFVIMMLLTSCSFSDLYGIYNQTGKETVYISNGNVYFQEATNLSTYTNLEEAVSSVYDGVVCISSLSGGEVASSGSGVIIGKNEENYYYIVTCCHVVDGYSDYIVTYSNQKYQSAELVGADEMTDLAILRVKSSEELKIVPILDDSNTIRLASEVFAIGNPLGTLANSVTKGIISSTSRNIKTSDGSVHNLLQTDAPINAGNSGGGLFNNQGELIGIVSAKYSATGVEGLGFAIPSNTVKTIVTSLIEKGYVEGRTILGITLSDGYVRSGNFFGNYSRVVYISAIDSKGSAYGKLSLKQIINAVSVTYKDGRKENKSLNTFSDANALSTFLDSLDLQIGDVVTFVVGSSGNTSSIDVEMKQYIYSS